MGATIWQGPHHAAQKSTRTKPPACSISLANEASLTCTAGLSVAPILLSPVFCLPAAGACRRSAGYHALGRNQWLLAPTLPMSALPSTISRRLWPSIAIYSAWSRIHRKWLMVPSSEVSHWETPKSNSWLLPTPTVPLGGFLPAADPGFTTFVTAFLISTRRSTPVATQGI